jgi:hypothetical protein
MDNIIFDKLKSLSNIGELIDNDYEISDGIKNYQIENYNVSISNGSDLKLIGNCDIVEIGKIFIKNTIPFYPSGNYIIIKNDNKFYFTHKVVIDNIPNYEILSDYPPFLEEIINKENRDKVLSKIIGKN